VKKIRQLSFDVHATGVRPLIDGVDLGSVVGPGSDFYGPLGFVAVNGQHFGGRPHPDWCPPESFRPEPNSNGRSGIIAVLNCSCGILDCGGLFAHVAQGGDFVVWDSFWSGLGRILPAESLAFHRRPYFEAVRWAASALGLERS
jgi:hypothetical protein